jgi:hypothetical protein
MVPEDEVWNYNFMGVKHSVGKSPSFIICILTLFIHALLADLYYC